MSGLHHTVAAGGAHVGDVGGSDKGNRGAGAGITEDYQVAVAKGIARQRRGIGVDPLDPGIASVPQNGRHGVKIVFLLRVCVH